MHDITSCIRLPDTIIAGASASNPSRINCIIGEINAMAIRDH